MSIPPIHRPSGRSLWTAGALLGLLFLCSPPVLAAWDLEQLMQRLAATKGGKATFVEKTFVAILDMPLESSGELIFVAPNHLEKRTLKPARELMVLEGDTLTIERDQRKTTLKLSDYPEVSAFIESIRGTLAGDRAALERQYHLALAGSAERWTLTLVPINSRMATIIQRITIQGAADRIRTIEFSQAGGDHSTMTITQATTP